MSKLNKTHLVVVLGMHRSGTSALARGLEVLGIRLGDNLHPAAIDNPKGFWEDRDVLAINEALLAHSGSAYDQLGFVEWDVQNISEIQLISLKAEKLLRKKFEENKLWGFKDPRTARLLPFWQSVFKQIGCDVSYVIAVRNPISIAESLRKRNGFDVEKTFYLWLEHLIPAIVKTKGAKRVVVDYDRLLNNPRFELLRVAQALGLPDPEPLALAAYENEFLEKELRHTLFTTHDLEMYPSVPPQLVTSYAWLVKLANDTVASDSVEVEQAYNEFSQGLIALSPALRFMARQEQELIINSQAAIKLEASLSELAHQVQEVGRLNETIVAKETAYQSVATELQRVYAALAAKNHAVELQTQEIHRISALVADKDAAVTHQAQEIGRLSEAVELKNAVCKSVATELQSVHVTLTVKNHDIEIKTKEISQLSFDLEESKSSSALYEQEASDLRSLLVERDQSIETLNKSLSHVEEVLTNFRGEFSRIEAELHAVRRTKWFRLRDAITHQPWGFKKVARVAYLTGAIMTPSSVRTKLSPLVYKFKARFNASESEILPNTSNNDAYQVQHPEPVVSNRANVVHVIANFMTGGSSRLVVDLIESLGTYYEQRVVTSFIPTPAAYAGIDIMELRFPVNEQPFVDYFSQLKPDLIHVHYWGDCDESWYVKAITAADKLGIPVIENINTPVVPYISDVIRRYVYVSDYVRHVFGQNHPSHITIYPGSDFSHFNRKFGERIVSDCIGMVYRLEHDKLNEDAIAPFIMAVKKRPRTRVLIVGGGSLLEPFRQKVAEAGLGDCFEFTGYVSYEALPDLYRRMSVFVAPVWKESFGQVSPFAMNMRIPVVGYDIGAIGEIVANQTLLAESGNADVLSDIIVRLLDSPSERKRIGEFQRRRAQDYFSVQAMVKAYEALYHEIMVENAKSNI